MKSKWPKPRISNPSDLLVCVLTLDNSPSKYNSQNLREIVKNLYDSRLPMTYSVTHYQGMYSLPICRTFSWQARKSNPIQACKKYDLPCAKFHDTHKRSTELYADAIELISPKSEKVKKILEINVFMSSGTCDFHCPDLHNLVTTQHIFVHSSCVEVYQHRIKTVKTADKISVTTASEVSFSLHRSS